METGIMQKQKVIIDGAQYEYPHGTPFRTIAADFQDRYPNDILLVNRDGKLCELHKVLDRDCTLRLVTARDVPGIQTYERSAVFLMIKAFYDVVGKENVERISVGYSVSRSLFIRAQGNFFLNQALLDQVEARMRDISSAALPIQKRSVSTDDAMELFRREGLVHKADLLSFRVNSHVNVYELDGFVDYFYGYMAPDAGYIRCFALERFEDGFVLRLPTLKNIALHVWEKVRGFLVKAGTLILAMSVLLWFLQAFGFENGGFGLVEDAGHSLLAVVGSFIAPLLTPLGFGTWQAAVALLTGLVAKEMVVSSMSMFCGFSVTAGGTAVAAALAGTFQSPAAAYAFLVFVLLYVPCVAAVSTIRKEMGSLKWTLASVGWQLGAAYIGAFVVYQVGRLFVG